jgi:hypothetical protein
LFFKSIEVETKFPFTNSISEFSPSQDPQRSFRFEAWLPPKGDDIIKQSGHPQKEIMQDVYKRGGAAVSERSHATRQKHRNKTQAS